MALSITHPFVSLKADGTDATLVKPSNWNAGHTITVATSTLVGRTVAGVGVATDIPIIPTIMTALQAADVTAFLTAMGIGAFYTGDIKPTLRTVADPGWTMCNDGTIGNAGSGATVATVALQALYLLIWTNISNSFAPVTGGRGASAINDFNALKPMALTKMLGRALGAAGAGAGLTARALGGAEGAEGVVLDITQIPAHNHGGVTGGMNANNPHTHGTNGGIQGGVASNAINFGGAIQVPSPTAGIGINVADIEHAHAIGAQGGGLSHNNMMPVTWVNFMIKI